MMKQETLNRDLFKNWWGIMVIVLVIGGGAYFTHFVSDYGENLDKLRLRVLAMTAAASFDAAKVFTLANQPSMPETADFRQVRDQLRRIKAANTDARFVYLLVLKKDQVVFLADAEPASSLDYSAPGDVYFDAPPGIYSIYATRTALVEGPYVDKWGEWITGLAPVIHPATGQVIAVLGIDINARHWLASISRYRWFGIAIALLVLGIVAVLVWGIYAQRRSQQRIDQYNQELLKELAKRMMAEDELQESEQRFRDLFNNSPDPCWLVDGFTYIDCNKAAVQILGYHDRNEILNIVPWQLSPARQSDGQSSITKVMKFIDDAYQQGLQRFEWEHVRLDGATFSDEVTLAPIVIRGKKVLYCSWHDITERKKAEAARLELEERLRRAEKMQALGLLSGGVAHDLNNVLGVVGGYAELLLQDMDEFNPLRPYAVHIKGASERSAAIIQDMLTLARRGVQAREAINLNTLILDYLSTPEFEKLAVFHPGVMVETRLETELLPIKGSPVQLRKTIMNLVANAAEAMPGGGQATIATSNQYLDRPVQGYDEVVPGDYVVLSVSDSGEGISSKDIKQIFEPFYTKKVMGRSGTGLGLAVVWGTVKDHQGYIDVRSEEGKGSTFTLYFPFTREEIKTEALPVRMSEYMGRGESILVVDDVEGQRDLAAAMLRKLNYNVATAPSGEEAVAYLEDQRVDLLVLDMIMDPGMDGLDTYRRVLERHPHQRAVIVSGFAETERVNAAQALGAGPYVKKPYLQEKLAAAVRQELDRMK